MFGIPLIEWIGYLASILIAISMFMKDIVKSIVDIVRFEFNSNYNIKDIIDDLKRKKDLKWVD